MQRYKLGVRENCMGSVVSTMIPDDNGDWVRYEDVVDTNTVVSVGDEVYCRENSCRGDVLKVKGYKALVNFGQVHPDCEDWIIWIETNKLELY